MWCSFGTHRWNWGATKSYEEPPIDLRCACGLFTVAEAKRLLTPVRQQPPAGQEGRG